MFPQQKAFLVSERAVLFVKERTTLQAAIPPPASIMEPLCFGSTLCGAKIVCDVHEHSSEVRLARCAFVHP